MKMKISNPTFKIFTGPMFSSKTSKLLMELERCKYQRKPTLVFKPSIDDRYDAHSSIKTHSGWSTPAICVKDTSDILNSIMADKTSSQIIAVDEAFMIPGIGDILVFLYRKGYSIIVSSLDMAANAKPFPEMVKILPWATHVEKCVAVCTICGQDAHYTHKKELGGDELTVEVGGTELYEPRCARCHAMVLELE